MLGTTTFVHVIGKRYPDGFQAGFAHRLALHATLWQLLIGGPLLVLMLAYDDTLTSALGASTTGLVLLGIAFACPMCYGLTRLGFRMGARSLQQIRESRRMRGAK